MIFKGTKISKNASNYIVSFSQKELDKWGRKMGFSAEEVFAVDTHVSDTMSETSIGFGAHGSELSTKNALIYHVVAKPQTVGGKEGLMVTFDLVSKFVDEVREDVVGVYFYFVKRKAYFRDAVDKFVRDLIKDGHLSFFPRTDEEVKAIEEKLGK